MNLKPARTEHTGSMKVICDFDALVNERVGFKFKNKYYAINNLTVETYMQVTLAYKNLYEVTQKRAKGTEYDQEKIYQIYFDFIHPLVPDLTYADLRQLSFVLMNQLISLVLRHVAGDPDLFNKDLEKKTLVELPETSKSSWSPLLRSFVNIIRGRSKT
jgi:hypothetical protein